MLLLVRRHRRNYDLYVDKRQFAAIRSGFLSWDFELHDEVGRPLAKIDRQEPSSASPLPRFGGARLPGALTIDAPSQELLGLRHRDTHGRWCGCIMSHPEADPLRGADC